MNTRRNAARLLRAVGVLLFVLGMVHLAATPHIPNLLGDSATEVYRHAVGPTLLNHVLVGILLLPLGFTTWLAAGARERSEPWAVRVLAANTLVVCTLPVSIVACMRSPEYYASTLFAAGAGLVAVISVLMVGATVLLMRK